MWRTAAIAVLLVALTACGDDGTDPSASTQAETQFPQPTNDPYDVWLANAPDGAPELTRDEAQARALLGCGQTWAPGTTDAVLAEAYAPLIEQWKATGHCG